MDKQYDTSILTIYIHICRNSGMIYIPLESSEIYNKYQTFADLYNELRKISSIEYINPPLNMNVVDENLHNMKTLEEAISYMNRLITKKNKDKELVDLDSEYNRKINVLNFEIKISGINPDDIVLLNSFAEQYRIINAYYSTYERSKELKALIKKVDRFYQIYLNDIEVALSKIRSIENILKTKGEREILMLYPDANPEGLKKQLFSLFENKSISEKSPSFIEFCKELDKIYNKVHLISTINLNPKITYSHFSKNYIVKYNIYGISIEVDSETKACKIAITNYDQLSYALLYYKKEHFIRFLRKILLSTPTYEIAKPTEVNEHKLSKYIKGKDFPIEEVLKYNVNDLLMKLGIYKELNQEISLKKLFSELHKTEKTDKNDLSIKLGHLPLLLKALVEDGYTLKFNGEKIADYKPLFSEILQIYKRISVHPTLDKKIETTIKEVLTSRSKEEQLVYSSIQSVYNCIDRDLISAMHSELTNKIPVDLANNLNKVIFILTKYARKKDGEVYTIEEILNFLKQKNQIVNVKDYPKTVTSYFIEEDIERTIAALSEYDEDDNIGLADIYEILYKITGRHR